jgi:hypothetical protein
MISQTLLDYKPKSIYFKQRWGDALAWVEEHNAGQVGNCGGIGNGKGRRGLVADVEGTKMAQGAPVRVRCGVGAVAEKVRQVRVSGTTGGAAAV